LRHRKDGLDVRGGVPRGTFRATGPHEVGERPAAGDKRERRFRGQSRQRRKKAG